MILFFTLSSKLVLLSLVFQLFIGQTLNTVFNHIPIFPFTSDEYINLMNKVNVIILLSFGFSLLPTHPLFLVPREIHCLKVNHDNYPTKMFHLLQKTRSPGHHLNHLLYGAKTQREEIHMQMNPRQMVRYINYEILYQILVLIYLIPIHVHFTHGVDINYFLLLIIFSYYI